MSARAVAIVAATTAALLIVALGGVWLLVRKLDARERAANPPRPPLQAGGDERPAGLPQPPLEGLPAQPPGSDRRAADTADDQIAAERDLLDSYGWVDRDKGIVRVPLERAARIALENRDKYLPAREQQPWWKAPVRGDKP